MLCFEETFFLSDIVFHKYQHIIKCMLDGLTSQEV